MKLNLLLILLTCSINTMYGQFFEDKLIYGSSQFNIGNYRGGDLNLNLLIKESYSIKIGFIDNSRKSKLTPDDYSPGLGGILLFGLTDPRDKLTVYELSVGKIYKLNKTENARVNLSLGVGYTIIREPENWKRTGGGSLETNYTWDVGNRKTISLIINPKFEFPFSYVYGLTISPLVIINKNRNYFGIGIGHMIGKLRHRENVSQN